jgi:hypothetical protein
MSIALTVKHLLACGASHEAVVKAVEELEASREEALARSQEAGREYERERKRNYRMSRGQAACPGDNGDILSPIPPIDNNIIKNISPRGCRGSGTNPRALGTNPKAAPCPWMPSFDQFYEVYPRKRAKGAAKKAFKNALSRATTEEILAGVKRYAAECVGREAQFIKMPASWLNAECWLDEPDKKPQANVVGFRKEFRPEPEGPKISEEERQRNLAKLTNLVSGTLKWNPRG